MTIAVLLPAPTMRTKMAQFVISKPKPNPKLKLTTDRRVPERRPTIKPAPEQQNCNCHNFRNNWAR